MTLKSHALIWTALAGLALSKLQSMVPSTCLPPEPQAARKSLYCECSTKCIDGTNYYFDSGACKTSAIFCQDIEPAKPMCKDPTHVLQMTFNDTWLSNPEKASGQCVGCGDGEAPNQDYGMWSCCPCPSGWVPLWTSCGGWAYDTPQSRIQDYSRCVRCSGAGETLVISQNGTALCKGCGDDDDDDGGEDGGEHKAFSRDANAMNTGCTKQCKSKQCPLSTPQPTPQGKCLPNAEGRAMTKKFESCCAEFYYINGHKTIGWGHDTFANKDEGSFHPPLALEDANRTFDSDIAKVAASIGKWTNAGALNSNQFSALVDFAFNTGAGGPKSTKGAWHYFHDFVKAKNYTALCDTFPNVATMKKYAQITERRLAEQALCKKPTSIPSGC